MTHHLSENVTSKSFWTSATQQRETKRKCVSCSHTTPWALLSLQLECIWTLTTGSRQPICRLLDTQTHMINCTADTHVSFTFQQHSCTSPSDGWLLWLKWSDGPTVISEATVNSSFPMMSISQLRSVTTASGIAAWLFSTVCRAFTQLVLKIMLNICTPTKVLLPFSVFLVNGHAF